MERNSLLGFFHPLRIIKVAKGTGGGGIQISCPSLPFANCDEIDGYLLSATQHHGLGLLLLLLLASGNFGNMRERNSIHRFLYKFCLQISVFF